MILDQQIIRRPILTEKMSKLGETQNQYAFEVRTDANKIEIKKVIERKFDVKVSRVRTLNFRGKHKEMTVRSGGRVIRTSGKRADWKKALVTLEEGFSIDLYGMETES